MPHTQKALNLLPLLLMELTSGVSRHNFNSFIWHSVFAAIAINFMDFDTVLPAMILQSGGTALHVGILTAILMGGAKLAQLPLAPLIQFRRAKKNILILGITIRFLALFSISALFYFSGWLTDHLVLVFIFVFISFFSFSEAFATLSYTDILGKSVSATKRSRFLSLRQILSSALIFTSSFVVKGILEKQGFPENYSMLFFIAGISLAFASLGFWKLKEAGTEETVQKELGNNYFRLIFKELKTNKVLQSYLIIINTLGIGTAVLPFMILFAKNRVGIEAGDVGNFVIMKTVGLIISGMVLFRLASRIRYKTMLYLAVGLAASIPVLGIFSVGISWLYSVCFLLGGIFISFFNVARTGVLLEISTNANRVLYTGIAGFGSLLVTIFPLLAGWVIDGIGFNAFLYLISGTILLSLFYIYRLRCTTA